VPIENKKLNAWKFERMKDRILRPLNNLGTVEDEVICGITREASSLVDDRRRCEINSETRFRPISDFKKKQEARRIRFTPVETLTIFHNGTLQPRADNC